MGLGTDETVSPQSAAAAAAGWVGVRAELLSVFPLRTTTTIGSLGMSAGCLEVLGGRKDSVYEE